MEINIEKNEKKILGTILFIIAIIVVYTETTIKGVLIFITISTITIIAIKRMQKIGIIPNNYEIKTMILNRKRNVKIPKGRFLTPTQYKQVMQRNNKKAWKPKW